MFWAFLLKIMKRKAAALDSVKCLKSATGCSFAVGECMNGDPFELALALVKYGFRYLRSMER